MAVEVEACADLELAAPHALLRAAIGRRRRRRAPRPGRARFDGRERRWWRGGARWRRLRRGFVLVLGQGLARLHARRNAPPELLFLGGELAGRSFAGGRFAAWPLHAAATRARRQFGSGERTSRSKVHFSRASR